MSKYKYDWENPAIFKRNKEDGHVIAFSYDNEIDALNRVEPKTKMTLNGTWKFHWQRGLNDCPTDFYKDSFDLSFWRDITVPSVWQAVILNIMLLHIVVQSAEARARFRQLTTQCRK